MIDVNPAAADNLPQARANPPASFFFTLYFYTYYFFASGFYEYRFFLCPNWLMGNRA
jgi:hypothetical protein